MIKNSWKIVDDKRTNVRSRLETMTGIKECYQYKKEMLGTERTLNEINIMYPQRLAKERGERINENIKYIKSNSRRKKINKK